MPNYLDGVEIAFYRRFFEGSLIPFMTDGPSIWFPIARMKYKPLFIEGILEGSLNPFIIEWWTLLHPSTWVIHLIFNCPNGEYTTFLWLRRCCIVMIFYFKGYYFQHLYRGSFRRLSRPSISFMIEWWFVFYSGRFTVHLVLNYLDGVDTIFYRGSFRMISCPFYSWMLVFAPSGHMGYLSGAQLLRWSREQFL